MPQLGENDLPDFAPNTATPDATIGPSGRPSITVRPRAAYSTEDDLPDYDASKAAPPARRIGGGEAFGRGAVDAMTFGAAPAIMGLSAAGTAPTAEGKEQEQLPMVGEFPGLEIPALGAARLSRGDQAAQQAYEKARAETAEARRQSFEQHPYASMGGELAGSLITPGFGAATPGTWGARLATGAVAGGVGGGLYGAGSAIGEGGGTEEALRSAMSGAALGAPFGSAMKGAVGPRLLDPALARAAQTARELGPGAPRGLVSNIPGVPQLTSGPLQSVPLAGYKIADNIKKLQAAAGERIGDIAAAMTPAGRDVADTAVRSGLQGAIDTNKAEIDALYGAVRGKLNPNTVIDTPQLRSALQHVIDRRVAKKQPNPEQGLDQFLNATTDPSGITFEGARGLRSDARDAGDLVNPHPGFNSADFNRLTQALTGDLRVAAHRYGAGAEFDEAEKNFERLAAQNKALNKIMRSGGQAAIDTLTGAARGGPGGNVKLLQQLKQSMPAADFEKIGGTILHELGASPATGEFSLDRFVTGWNKLAENAKQAMFSDAHLKNIDDIVNMGQKFKGAMATANKVHTPQAIIFWEMARDAVEFGAAVAGGLVPLHAVAVPVAGSIGLNLFTRWLASPSKAAAMSMWGRALQGMQQVPTLAALQTRAAVFNSATRNLSRQLHVPVENILHAGLRATTADNAPANNR